MYGDYSRELQDQVAEDYLEQHPDFHCNTMVVTHDQWQSSFSLLRYVIIPARLTHTSYATRLKCMVAGRSFTIVRFNTLADRRRTHQPAFYSERRKQKLARREARLRKGKPCDSQASSRPL